MSEPEPNPLIFENVSPEVEKELEEMVYQNCLKMALFKRKWNREQREKKRQEREQGGTP